MKAACSSKEAIWLSLSLPVLHTPSANPDKSTSDLHHSSPQARISRPPTHCKASSANYHDLAGYKWGKAAFFGYTHTRNGGVLIQVEQPQCHTRGCIHARAHIQAFLYHRHWGGDSKLWRELSCRTVSSHVARGSSMNAPHPASGLSSAAKQPNYGWLCFDGNRTGCQYY